MTEKTPNQTNIVDQMIGKQIQHHRKARGLSQSGLAIQMDMSLKDYEAREHGDLRFSPTDIVKLSRILDVPIEALFPPVATTTQHIDQLTEPPGEIEIYDLLHFYGGIASADTRRMLLDLIKNASDFKH